MSRRYTNDSPGPRRSDNAFTGPDHHTAFGPTYENRSILRWLVNHRG